MTIYDLSNECWAQTNPVASVTATTFPSKIPTTTQPSGDGVIVFGHGGGEDCPGHLMLIPYGAGSATNTMNVQVIGWRATRLNIGVKLWIPVVLCTYAVTLGTGTGVAGADLTTTALFATTITSTGGPTFITSGAAPVSIDWLQISPGSNGIGMISQRSFGFRLLEVIFNTNSSATSCNALYCKM